MENGAIFDQKSGLLQAKRHLTNNTILHKKLGVLWAKKYPLTKNHENGKWLFLIKNQVFHRQKNPKIGKTCLPKTVSKTRFFHQIFCEGRAEPAMSAEGANGGLRGVGAHRAKAFQKSAPISRAPPPSQLFLCRRHKWARSAPFQKIRCRILEFFEYSGKRFFGFFASPASPAPPLPPLFFPSSSSTALAIVAGLTAIAAGVTASNVDSNLLTTHCATTIARKIFCRGLYLGIGNFLE